MKHYEEIKAFGFVLMKILSGFEFKIIKTLSTAVNDSFNSAPVLRQPVRESQHRRRGREKLKLTFISV